MARMRAIKPGFFTNDALAEIAPLGRLLFAGLWTIADRAGRLEDRPRKIKAELLPYDDCDADALLGALAARGFVVRYAVNGTPLIQVVHWDKHQQPHVNERESDYPAPVQVPEQHGASTMPAPECSDTNPSEQNSNSTRTEPDLELEDEAAPTAPAAAALSESVSRLNQLLTGQRGWEPSPNFLDKLATKYDALDLEAEALKILDWLRTKGNRKQQPCSMRFVLNWLETAGRDAAHSEHTRSTLPPHVFQGDPRTAHQPKGWVNGRYFCRGFGCGWSGHPRPGDVCRICQTVVPDRVLVEAQ